MDELVIGLCDVGRKRRGRDGHWRGCRQCSLAELRLPSPLWRRCGCCCSPVHLPSPLRPWSFPLLRERTAVRSTAGGACGRTICRYIDAFRRAESNGAMTVSSVSGWTTSCSEGVLCCRLQHQQRQTPDPSHSMQLRCHRKKAQAQTCTAHFHIARSQSHNSGSPPLVDSHLMQSLHTPTSSVPLCCLLHDVATTLPSYMASATSSAVTAAARHPAAAPSLLVAPFLFGCGSAAEVLTRNTCFSCGCTCADRCGLPQGSSSSAADSSSSLRRPRWPPSLVHPVYRRPFCVSCSSTGHGRQRRLTAPG